MCACVRTPTVFVDTLKLGSKAPEVGEAREPAPGAKLKQGRVGAVDERHPSAARGPAHGAKLK